MGLCNTVTTNLVWPTVHTSRTGARNQDTLNNWQFSAFVWCQMCKLCNSWLFGRGRCIKLAGISSNWGKGRVSVREAPMTTAITGDSTADAGPLSVLFLSDSIKLRIRHAPRQTNATECLLTHDPLSPLGINHRNHVAGFQKCRVIKYTDHHNTTANKIGTVCLAFARNHRTKVHWWRDGFILCFCVVLWSYHYTAQKPKRKPSFDQQPLWKLQNL